jgi:hypothetical protein
MSEQDDEHVLRVREGHGANCSSVGSVVDTVFLGAVVGGVVIAMVAAALKKEPITIVGGSGKQPDREPPTKDDDAT